MMNNYTNGTVVDVGSGDFPMFRLRTIQQVNRFVCGIIGIPLNLLVVAVILRSRQLWTARNIFWLAINFFNTLALTQAIIELAAFYLYQRGDDSHRILCQIYSTIVGGPYVLLLAGLMLATLDRHLALVHRQFYQNYATPTNVIWILFGITLVVVGRYKLFFKFNGIISATNFNYFSFTGGQTSPYWLRIFPVSCNPKFGWLFVTLTFQGILSLASIVIQIRLYILVRSCILHSPPTNNTMELVAINRHLSRRQRRRHDNNNGYAERISRIEMRAARILGIGILPFCLMALSIFAINVAMLVCRYLDLDTSWIKLVMEIFREFLILHLIYIPSIYAAHSREFKAAGRRFFRFQRPKPIAVVTARFA